MLEEKDSSEETVQDQGVSEESVSGQEAEKPVTTEAGGEAKGDKPEVTEYQPNLKYKVYDKEKDFPEWAKALVTSKEMEENFRTLWSKSDAFDTIKEKHESLRNEHEALRGTHENVMTKLQEMQYFIDNDLGTFFKKANISEEAILNYVKQRIQYNDLSPELRKAYDDRSQYLNQQWQVSQQARQLAERNNQLMANQHEIEYEQVLSMPEVVRFKQAFETRMGEGSFRKFADQYGHMQYLQTKKNIKPVEAVKYVIDTYKPLLALDAESSAGVVTTPKPQAHIPTVGKGSSVTAPVKKRPRTVEEIRKIYRDMVSNG